MFRSAVRPFATATGPYRSGLLTRGAARHGRPTRYPRLEPAGWLLSAAGRGWRWMWSDHDDAVCTTVAWLLRFSLVATVFFVTVAGTR